MFSGLSPPAAVLLRRRQCSTGGAQAKALGRAARVRKGVWPRLRGMKLNPSPNGPTMPGLAVFTVLLGLVSLGNGWAAWLPLALCGIGAGLAGLWVAKVLLSWLWRR